MIRVGVFGSTGYTGLELLGILARHPGVEIGFACSGSMAGRSLSEVHPQAPDIPMIAPDAAPLETVEAVFLCLPHAASATMARRALDAGARVIDLSADFRLRDPDAYARWYGGPHPHPELLDEAVYGLTEWVRPLLPAARLVANPGCYATSVLMPLAPLALAGALDKSGSIVADSKSGVSGAGRPPKAHTHFVEVAENFGPYAIGRSHRHLPEMEQILAGWGPAPPLIFSPHLLPVRRGILSTLYVPLAAGWDEARARAALADAYAGEPFVRLLPEGQLPSLAHVVGTNRCAIGTAGVHAGTLLLCSALDNLVKGAAGQAVQNLNAMFGVGEGEGLV